MHYLSLNVKNGTQRTTEHHLLVYLSSSTTEHLRAGDFFPLLLLIDGSNLLSNKSFLYIQDTNFIQMLTWVFRHITQWGA